MKTVFSRTLSTISLVLFISILLFGFVARFEFSRLFLKEKEANLQKECEAICEISADFFRDPDEYSEESFLAELELSSKLTATKLLLINSNGRILYCSHQSDFDNPSKVILSNEASESLKNDSPLKSDDLNGLFSEKKYYVSMPLLSADGLNLGYTVIVYAETEQIGIMLAKTTNIFVIIALIVFLLAILASSYLAKKEAVPLKELSSAAAQFGRGNFAVRASVGKGSTEEERELTRAFNRMAESIENSDRQRKEFIANVSHELKTPMTSIAGYMDGMIDGTIPQEDHEKYMRRVSEEVRRLSRLVRNMLEISRIQDKGMPEEKKRKFDICESIGRTLLSFEQKIHQKSLFVEVHMPDMGLTVKADEDSITQVIYNLLDNAVKFCNDNGHIFIQASSDGAKVSVGISNTGPTISEEEIPFVFDRFHKADKSRSIDRDGAGLGLYLVKTILLAHGEDVTVTSRDNVTRFTFTLPFSG